MFFSSNFFGNDGPILLELKRMSKTFTNLENCSGATLVSAFSSSFNSGSSVVVFFLSIARKRKRNKRTVRKKEQKIQFYHEWQTLVLFKIKTTYFPITHSFQTDWPICLTKRCFAYRALPTRHFFQTSKDQLCSILHCFVNIKFPISCWCRTMRLEVQWVQFCEYTSIGFLNLSGQWTNWQQCFSDPPGCIDLSNVSVQWVWYQTWMEQWP